MEGVGPACRSCRAPASMAASGEYCCRRPPAWAPHDMPRAARLRRAESRASYRVQWCPRCVPQGKTMFFAHAPGHASSVIHSYTLSMQAIKDAHVQAHVPA
eukprot:361100-Chlamydomonas_euryale.AAC.10